MTIQAIRAFRKAVAEAVSIVDITGDVYAEWAARIRYCSDWWILVEFMEAFESDDQLTDAQKDSLTRMLEARDLQLRPRLQAATVHEDTAVPDHEEGAN